MCEHQCHVVCHLTKSQRILARQPIYSSLSLLSNHFRTTLRRISRLPRSNDRIRAFCCHSIHLHTLARQPTCRFHCHQSNYLPSFQCIHYHLTTHKNPVRAFIPTCTTLDTLISPAKSLYPLHLVNHQPIDLHTCFHSHCNTCRSH